MRICLFLLFGFVFHTQAIDTNAQNATIVLSSNSVSINQLISEIEKQTDYLVVYSNSEVNTSRIVNLKNKSDNVSEYLNQMFSGTNVGYDFENNYIVLSKKAEGAANFLAELVNSVKQQGRTIRGTVTDMEGEPVIGATLIVKDVPSQGTVTDIDGNFILVNIPDDAVLQITYVGMKPQEISTSGRSTIDIILESDMEMLDEIIVVGYGTMRKRDLSGSVVSVKTEDIKTTPAITMDQALLGRAAGVQVVQNAEPGSVGTVRIRGISTTGDNNPLWVIDGIPSSPNNLNPNDIESMDVLKDAASTAIYGSRGANGVIIVTTKKGKSGKPRLELSTYIGFNQIAKKLDVMNAAEFALLANEAYTNDGLAPNPAWSNPESLETTDWQDAVTRKGFIQNYNLSISGGNENLTSILSLNYSNIQGPLIRSDNERYTIHTASDYKMTDFLKFGGTLYYSNNSSNYIPTRSYIDGILNQATEMWPDEPVYNEDGSYNILMQSSDPNYYPRQFTNPVARVNLRDQTGTNRRLLSSLYAELEIMKGLIFRTTLGIENGSSNSKYFAPKYETEPRNWLNRTQNVINWSMNESISYTSINTLTYNKEINKHNFTSLLGMEASKGNSSSVSVDASNTPTNALEIPSAALTRLGGGGKYDYASLSYFGRLNYIYDDRYILQFNLRADGSNNFAPENQWGYFPSISGAWRVSQENFINLPNYIYDLKLRVSYGATGNASGVGSYPYLSTYSTPSAGYVFGSGSQQIVSAYQLQSLANPDLKWETQKMTDIGLDAVLFNNSLSLTVDYYRKLTSGLLASIPVPATMGAPNNSITQNSGEILNKGIELAATYNGKVNDFNYNVGFNITTVKNKVIALGGDEIISSVFLTNGNSMQIKTSTGRSIGEFYGYVTDGIYQNENEIPTWAQEKGLVPGDRRYKDLGGPDGIPDGEFDELDRVFLGSPIPKLFYGGNLGFQYKNFDFSMFLQGQVGNKILNVRKAQLYPIRNYSGSGVNSGVKDALNRWHGEGTSNYLPRLSYSFQTHNWLASDFFIEDGSFLRVRTIQVGYNISNSFINRNITNLRFFLNVQNPFTFTKYSGYDPEILNDNPISSNVDLGQYPVYKTYTIGINLQF